MGSTVIVKQALKPGKALRLLVDDLDTSELLSRLDQEQPRHTPPISAQQEDLQLRRLASEVRDELTNALKLLEMPGEIGSHERLRRSIEAALSRTLMMCTDEGGNK
jgi:hypothetical protein